MTYIDFRAVQLILSTHSITVTALRSIFILDLYTCSRLDVLNACTIVNTYEVLNVHSPGFLRFFKREAKKVLEGFLWLANIILCWTNQGLIRTKG